jgi:hypothetical protein
MTCRVIVCDDEPEIAKQWVADIGEALPDGKYDLAGVPSKEEIKEAIQVLLKRRRGAAAAERCLFDYADVLVLDYDLYHVDEENTRYTGEGVARLVRVHSECAVIVVLNQFMDAQFDLGMRGHIDSFADLNLDGDLVGAGGLWNEGPWTEFRPWIWPVLHDSATRFRAREAALILPDALHRPIVELMGMKISDAGRLSDTAFGFVAPDARDYDSLAKKTFADFIAGKSSGIEGEGGSSLLNADPAACARIASSRIAKWLEREVLGPQDVLVDVPHLLQRCPYLLAGDISDLNTWNAALFDGKKAIGKIIPADAWFGAENWLGQPVLWWPRVEALEEVREARGTFDFAKAPDFVFMEDASCFGTLADATEFRAGFHNSYDRRYLKKFENIRYAPQRRLAFGG